MPCDFFGSDLKIKTSDDHVRYPDGFVTCAGGDNTSTMVSDPVVIFEVLSPSTAANDRIVKAREYQAMPSVQRYVMLEQDRIGATAYARSGETWTLEILIEDSVLALPEIGVTLPLAELYEGLVFEAEQEGDEAPGGERV
jgi:Uma2 family endonuclease